MVCFGDTRYERLTRISVAHLYNLRQTHGYAVRRRHWTKTRGHNVPIGIRRPPTSQGRPGLIRIDSVHQGDQDGVKGLSHDVNAFCRDFLNPYVNFHRPCFFPESVTDAKGRTRKRYRFEDVTTPYEKLKSLPQAVRSSSPA